MEPYRIRIKEGVKRDIIILTVPSREEQIKTLLKCLSDLDSEKHNIILVCNTNQDAEAEAFVKRVFNLYNVGSLSHQVVYNSDKTLPTGRNKGLACSVKNLRNGPRLTYFVDDDIVIYKPNEIFSFLEQGLQYSAFVGYPTFELLSEFPRDRSLTEVRKVIAGIVNKQVDSEILNYLELEKPRRYTPFMGKKYEIARVLYGHVHGNLQLHFTRVWEKLVNQFGEENIFNDLREWYGEWTELNYRLQRHGFMGGFLYRSGDKMEQLFNAEEWGLVFHNNISSVDSPTRDFEERNMNMMKSYIYLGIEANVIPIDVSRDEFFKCFLHLINTDFRFLKTENQEFAKLLQVRYSTQKYLFGNAAMSNEEFVSARRKMIGTIYDEIEASKKIQSFLMKRKLEYETAPFQIAPFEQMSEVRFREYLRFMNEMLKSFREEIFDYE